MSITVDHRCIHCGYWKGEHKANTFNCPIKSRSRSFRQYNNDRVYEADPKKPKTVPFQI